MCSKGATSMSGSMTKSAFSNECPVLCVCVCVCVCVRVCVCVCVCV